MCVGEEASLSLLLFFLKLNLDDFPLDFSKDDLGVLMLSGRGRVGGVLDVRGLSVSCSPSELDKRSLA